MDELEAGGELFTVMQRHCSHCSPVTESVTFYTLIVLLNKREQYSSNFTSGNTTSTVVQAVYI